MSSELFQPQRTMHGVVLNALDIFMSCPVIDALVNVIIDVS